MAQVRAEVLISGRVQGVCFRHYTQKTAQSQGVRGWCRNRPDGRVEAVFEGEESAVKAVIDWCRRGPELARVDDLQLSWADATGEFGDFSVRH
jgi:acylphosphatase